MLKFLSKITAKEAIAGLLFGGIVVGGVYYLYRSTSGSSPPAPQDFVPAIVAENENAAQLPQTSTQTNSNTEAEMADTTPAPVTVHRKQLKRANAIDVPDNDGRCD
uniref:Uncharacterized protein n=1 Tax=Graphocephala atropunctata TaxID=36148 RepID=A0A1B6KX26_9HEMI